MLETDEDLETYPGHPDTAARFLNDAKRAGEPIAIGINGKFSLSIGDDESFQKLLELVDRLERVATLRERLKYFADGGEGISLEEVKEQARTKYGIPL